MTTKTDDLVIQTIKTETTASSTINGWNVTFTYKSLGVDGSEKPNDFSVLGNKMDGTGSFTYNLNQNMDSLNFNNGAKTRDNLALVQSVLDKIDLLTK